MAVECQGRRKQQSPQEMCIGCCLADFGSEKMPDVWAVGFLCTVAVF